MSPEHPIGQWREDFKHKLVLPNQLTNWREAVRATGYTLATLNGSFDLLHAGHLQIVYEASQVADVLLVALNSDLSIRQYKGSDRPIIPLEYRLQMMAALEFVQYVTWFDELDPRALLEVVRPDVHVNGAEYGASCIEAEVVQAHGGRLHVVELIPGLSTTQILKKIASLS